MQLQQGQSAVDGVGQTLPVDEFVSQREAVRDDLAALLGLESHAAVAEDRTVPFGKGKRSGTGLTAVRTNNLTGATLRSTVGFHLNASFLSDVRELTSAT